MLPPDRTDDNSSPDTDSGERRAQFQPPTINLPKGGGAIRGIGEKFAANPVTGTGSMTVPIPTSPGRAGFGPELTLRYDSGAGNGPFGFGWSLSLPMITRKTEKGLPRYQNAQESDIFILSGAEDLVPVLVEGEEGWHRDASERTVDGVTYDIDRYRPRIEGLFARIERWTRKADGDVHWRSISRDNVLSIYGKDEGSRIFDPEDHSRIFTWLICETRDDRGNAAVYTYKAEDGSGVNLKYAHERNRGDRDDARRAANRYLKRIHYGNRRPLLDEQGRRPPFLDGVRMRDAGWMFEVVFDYGEHEAPSVEEDRPWDFRADPFSIYRAGFEVRTTRLCQRVLMFHHFPGEEGVGADCLVRSTDFTYTHELDPANARNPVYTFLLAVTQTGYKRQGDGYLQRSLPPVEFEYTQPVVQDTVDEVDPASLENLPAGLDGAAYQWTDLHGEGIPGILSEQGGAWFYKRNLSPLNGEPSDGASPVQVTFASVETVGVKPNLSLSGGQARFMDLGGDGQPDLVVLDGPVTGLYEHDGEEGWQAFRPFRARLNRNTADPNLRFIDLDGNGHVDVLITENDAFVWHPSLAEQGFGAAQRVAQALDEERGPRLVFADAEQSIYAADMSGDGLTDLVRLRNGEVCYWPNLGYGRFGAKISMDHAPIFDNPGQFHQQRVRLADIDGTGTNDIVYLHREGVRLYFNQSGNSWSAPQALAVFPQVDNVVAINAVDLLGNGTACLVWSSPLRSDAGRQMRYVDLMGGQKPHLLVQTQNNLGARTRVHYASSTRFYLQDKQDGRPWITRLPFPVHVVERVETYDHISRNRFVTRYAYHHGYFDGEEREFRGFGMVEQFDTEEFASLNAGGAFPTGDNVEEASHVRPVHVKTWFHTGVYVDREHVSRQYEDEYYREPGLDEAQQRALLLPDTLLPEGLTFEEQREACRALKGMMLRQEVYALDDSPQKHHPYSVAERSYKLKLFQPRADNRNAVFYTCACNSIDYYYERNPHDPRINHQMSLEVDKFGNVLKALAIGYGRRAKNSTLAAEDRAKQEKLLMTYTETDVTNVVDEPDNYRTPLPWEVRTYELTGYNMPDGTERFHIGDFVADDFALVQMAVPISYETRPEPGRRQKRLLEQGRTLFRARDLGRALPPGQVDALALPYEQYRLALTPGLLDLYAEKIARADLETILAQEGRYVALDDDGQWWVPSGQIFYSPNPDDAPGAELAHARQHFFLPHRFQDPFGETAVVRYDDDTLLVQETIDPLDNRVRAVHDYRVLQPRQMIDPNGNRTAVNFDALGMVVGQAVMGKVEQNEGDSLETFEPELTPAQIRHFLRNPQETAASLLGNATARSLYDLHAFADWGQPVYSATLAREQHVSDLDEDEDSPIQISFTYADGFGREVQTKVQAESGLAPARETNGDNSALPGRLIVAPESGEPVLAETETRWVGNGRIVYNNKGNPVKQYEPFFSSTHLFETDAEMVETGVTPILFYDPLERVVATLHPNHTCEKVVFDPWQQATWDVNDTILQTDPKDDPDVGGFFRRLPQAEYLPSWYVQRRDGALGKEEQAAAEKAAVHANTPTVTHLDSLGRPFLAVANNGVDENGRPQLYETRTEQDLEGQTLAVIDALGRTVMEYRLHSSGWLPGYDVAGNQLYQKSMEAGARWLLPDVGGKPIRTWDDRGFQRRMTYDALQRPLDIFVRPQDETEFLAEKTAYGESKAEPEASNHRAQVWQVYDAAGIVTSEAYDFKGNLLTGTRQFLRDYRQQVDWTADPDLEDEQFSSHTRYDALNRPVTLTTPDNSVMRPYFNEANLLERVEANLRGVEATTTFVTNIDYNARGQREAIVYGNGVTTTYNYDRETFRLTRLHTQRSEAALQDLRYTYDPAGNITHIADEAQQTIFFKNDVVSPHNDYTYDAIYRLIRANGREQIGQTGQPETDWRDEHRTGLVHPHDGQAMRRYSEQYRYDEVGNILRLIHRAQDGNWTRDYAYEEPSLLQPALNSNRLSYIQMGERQERYRHDAHGNMTAMPHLTQVAWNYQDQLRRVELSDGGTAAYLYDAAGQRVRKVIERQNGTRQKERLYLGELEIYREYNSKGEEVTLARESLHLMDDTQRIALVETRTKGDDDSPQQLIRFQLSNHLGSATLELDDHAHIISYEEYTPYGSTSYQAVRSQTETPKRYRYTGKERDEENGFYYHGARYYAPWLSRWTSADPAGLVDGSNLYRYGRNNPIMNTDPTGTECGVDESCDPTLPTAREEALQQSLPEDERHLPPPSSSSPSSARSHPTPVAPQWEPGPRGERIPTASWGGGPLRPVDAYTKPYARMYAAQGDYEAAELAENYMCPTCHVLTKVDPSEFSLRGYVDSYLEGYAFAQELLLTANPVGAGWELGISTAQAITGESSGLHIGNMVRGNFDAGRELSTSERFWEGGTAAVGWATLGLSARARPQSLSMNSSSALSGVEPASDDLIRAISARRTVQIAAEGSEEMRYLDWIGAEANVGGENMTHILLRPNPSKAAVLEEFLHGTQQRLGIIDRLGHTGMGSAETHVKNFMIRHRRLLGLSDEDVAILIRLRDMGL